MVLVCISSRRRNIQAYTQSFIRLKWACKDEPQGRLVKSWYQKSLLPFRTMMGTWIWSLLSTWSLQSRLGQCCKIAGWIIKWKGAGGSGRWGVGDPANSPTMHGNEWQRKKIKNPRGHFRPFSSQKLQNLIIMSFLNFSLRNLFAIDQLDLQHL